MEKPAVVVSDLHGQFQKLLKVVMHYGNDYRYIFNGDMIDRGPEVRGTLELIRSMGELAIVLTGNHEWVLRAALTDADPERREAWRDEAWYAPSIKRRLESRTLESYGVLTNRSNADMAKELRHKMYDAGHLELLEDAELYYEDDELLVVHAGVDLGRTWQSQRRDLDTAASLARDHIFMDEPAQLFDFRLGDAPNAPRDVWSKTLITGHTHHRWDEKGRIWWGSYIHRPSRVRLASHLAAGDKLYVYETDSHEIRAF